MMRPFLIFICLVALTACDDGDILTIDLEFDQELELCENFEESYLVFDTRNNPNESLSLLLPKNDTNQLLFTEPTPVDDPIELAINGSTVRFNYRSYNRSVNASDLCTVITPADLTILEDYEAPSGTLIVTVNIEDDDNDGIPSDDEGRGTANEDGEFINALDSDGDGIPDYIDEDDDNDNVRTINEDDNTDGDANPFTNPRDTDGDGIPDYLDNDDDGDGTLTRLEDFNEDGNPLNDLVVDENGINVARFLYELASEESADVGFLGNEYSRTVESSFLVLDVSLGPVNTTVIEFGTYTNIIEDYPNSLEDN
ncbi:MAG: hypothetical protein HKN40_10445 [Winogradskyella sp.]|uniref:hypothetical protein n=1 Tax=Winogradskyella sp. TaxID=1883156 RepID=UPI0017C1FC3E|nr:hypothetical protein [Winogradskyella sp.]